MASHMPDGGLDSSSFVEALRSIRAVLLPEELVPVTLLSVFRRVESSFAGPKGATFSFLTFAMTGCSPNKKSQLQSIRQAQVVCEGWKVNVYNVEREAINEVGFRI